MNSLTEAPFGFQLAMVVVFGLLYGSFFNVLIVRLPREQGIGGRSKCSQCQKTIRWFHNIPVLSYLWLRGRCAYCGKGFSIQYLVVEVFTAVLFVYVFWKHGLTLRFLGYAIFTSLLLVISVIDLHHRIIPDELSLGGLVAGFLYSFVWPDTYWIDSGLGILLGGGTFLAVALLYEKISGREGLGGGDIKLLGMIGAWLGYQSILLVVMISSALGSVVGVAYMIAKKGDLKSAIPFGPFLAAAAFLCAFYGKGLLYLLYPSMQ